MALIVGTSAADSLQGGTEDDTLQGSGGNDTLDGGGGDDIALYLGNAADYRFGVSGGRVTVTDLNSADGDEGTDTLIGIATIRFADRDYRLVNEARVNTTDAGDQTNPATGELPGGDLLLVWQTGGQDGSGEGIFAQRLDAAGLPMGSEFQVNSESEGDQTSPVIAVLSDGSYVIAWVSAPQAGGQTDIYARHYSALGVASGSDFRINSYATGDQAQVTLSALDGGGFVAVWSSDGQDGSGDGIYARRFSNSATAIGSEFRANSTTLNQQSDPSISALADGGFVIGWQSLQQDGSYFGTYSQRYSATGVAQGGETLLNATTSLNQLGIAIGGLVGGGYAAAWSSQNQDGSGFGIFASVFAADGSVQVAEFQVNSFSSRDQQNAALVPLAGGGFVVSWESRLQDGSGYGIYAQAFDASGTAQGSEFRVNDTTSNHQIDPSLVALDTGGFVVSWQSYLQDGDGYGVYVQIYDGSGTPAGCPAVEGTDADDWIDLSGPGALRGAGLLGDDVYVVDSLSDLVIENFAAGTDTVEASLSWTLGANLENLRLIGSANVDATGNELANVITGNIGNNVLDGGTGADTMAGGPGDDTYLLRSGDNIVEFPGEGTDTVISDTSLVLFAHVENLVLTGTIGLKGTGNALNNMISGTVGDDTLLGAFGNDSLVGGDGADKINGGLGVDTVVGGAGNDVYTVDADDIIVEAVDEGVDTVVSTVSYTLAANVENIRLLGANPADATGNSLRNVMSGNNGENVLSGLGGNDLLNGGASRDTLMGGAGNDVLIGGNGADVFVFDTPLDASTNVDSIRDYVRTAEKIWLDDDVFTAFNAGVSAFVSEAQFYKGVGAVSAHDADDRIIYDISTGTLYYDPDGLGGSVATPFAVLGTDSHPNITTLDFLIVD